MWGKASLKFDIFVWLIIIVFEIKVVFNLYLAKSTYKTFKYLFLFHHLILNSNLNLQRRKHVNFIISVDFILIKYILTFTF
jgi:hypothetical protein